MFIISLTIFLIGCSTQKFYNVYSDKKIQEIEFELIRNQIVFKTQLNGKPLNLMLDTGGNPSLIDTEIASEFNWIDTSKWGYASGVGEERIKIYLAKIENLAIKAAKYDKISAVAMNLDKISEKLGLELSGILGFSFLENQIIQINYPKKKIRIYPQETLFEKRNTSKRYQNFNLRFPVGKTIPLIKGIKLNNYKGNATVDTGSSIDVDIKSYMLDSIGLDKSMLIEGEKVYGASGEETVSEIKINSIQLGSIHIANSTMATVINDENYELNEVGINIGNGILKEFIVTFDYISNQLIIEKPM